MTTEPSQPSPPTREQVLCEVIRSIMQYPEFDSPGSWIHEMVDEALSGKTPHIFADMETLAQGYSSRDLHEPLTLTEHRIMELWGFRKSDDPFRSFTELIMRNIGKHDLVESHETSVKFKVTEEGKNISFHCPGCKMLHSIPVNTPNGWQWNGDVVKPTISPSIKVTGVELTIPDHLIEAFTRAYPGRNLPSRPRLCHSFIREGRIEYCDDTLHNGSGYTWDLPKHPDA